MAFEFERFSQEGLDEGFVEWLINERLVQIGQHFDRLWKYYHNPMSPVQATAYSGGRLNPSLRSYVQAQEMGLPARITGVQAGPDGGAAWAVPEIERKEVVIENDIAWRIGAMVDFLFGKGVKLVSTAPDATRRSEIEQILDAVFAGNGGVDFFQDMAVLGSVYGFVDCVLRPGGELLGGFNGTSDDHIPTSPPIPSRPTSPLQKAIQAACGIGLDLVEAPRALPVLDENDYRRLQVYVQHYPQARNRVKTEGRFLSRILGTLGRGGDTREVVEVTEVLGATWWQRYEDRTLAAEGSNPLGEVPVVHVQNLAQPYYYEGISDVEQLIPLQDELNTRLSDRASRITMQAFKMYLARGLDGFEKLPVSPGRMWCTDNTDASIQQFGGDERTPSEDRHIAEVREAMDKISGVTPVVAGVLSGKIGNLTSSVALKMTFMGMLAKTVRKQKTYSEGIAEICRMALKLLDVSGVYRTDPDERRVQVVFPNPLPEDEQEKLQEAQMKLDLGVPREIVLRELGYTNNS